MGHLEDKKYITVALFHRGLSTNAQPLQRDRPQEDQLTLRSCSALLGVDGAGDSGRTGVLPAAKRLCGWSKI